MSAATLRCPVNKAIVLIENMWLDEIKFGSGVVLYMDTSFNPEWNVTISGKVVSRPSRINYDNSERVGLFVEDVEDGDELLFKYLVVADRDFSDDPDAFYKTEESVEPAKRVFTNGRREKIIVQCFDHEGGKLFAAVLLDQYGDWVSGIQGKQGKVEKWCAQFKYLGDGDISYRNMMLWEGQAYWFVDYSLVIGKKRVVQEVNEEGVLVNVEKLSASRGYVWVEPIEVDLGPKTDGGIIIPEYLRKQKSKRTGIVRYIGPPRKGKLPLDLVEGETVVWNEKMGEQYDIGGMPWIVLKQEQILGKIPETLLISL